MTKEDLRQEKLDEMRYDMLMEQKLRTDDDYFYDYLEDNFGDNIREIVCDIENTCKIYDREPDEWIEFLLQK